MASIEIEIKIKVMAASTPDTDSKWIGEKKAMIAKWTPNEAVLTNNPNINRLAP
jgi:hypothetical protein